MCLHDALLIESNRYGYPSLADAGLGRLELDDGSGYPTIWKLKGFIVPERVVKEAIELKKMGHTRMSFFVGSCREAVIQIGKELYLDADKVNPDWDDSKIENLDGSDTLFCIQCHL